jgi:hypothetical protein
MDPPPRAPSKYSSPKKHSPSALTLCATGIASQNAASAAFIDAFNSRKSFDNRQS